MNRFEDTAFFFAAVAAGFTAIGLLVGATRNVWFGAVAVIAVAVTVFVTVLRWFAAAESLKRR